MAQRTTEARAQGEEYLKQGEEQQAEYEINLLELAYRLLENAKYIVAAALIGALLSGVFTVLLIKPKYTATSKLYVLNANDSAINLSDLQIGTYLAADYQEVFSNWHVHEMVIQRLGLNYSYKQLTSMVTVSNPSGTRILYINAESGDPDEAKLLADTYTQVAQEFIAATMEAEKPNIFEEALRPTAPSSPSKTRNVIVGFLLGALLAVGFFTVQFIADDRIRSGEDIERYLNLPTLGMMPQQSRRAVPNSGREQRGKRGTKI